jgi:hypothetical protein
MGSTPIFRRAKMQMGTLRCIRTVPRLSFMPNARSTAPKEAPVQTLAPHASLSMWVDIPDGYVSELLSHTPNNARGKGIVICVGSGDRNTCTNSGVVIPADA